MYLQYTFSFVALHCLSGYCRRQALRCDLVNPWLSFVFFLVLSYISVPRRRSIQCQVQPSASLSSFAYPNGRLYGVGPLHVNVSTSANQFSSVDAGLSRPRPPDIGKANSSITDGCLTGTGVMTGTQY